MFKSHGASRGRTYQVHVEDERATRRTDTSGKQGKQAMGATRGRTYQVRVADERSREMVKSRGLPGDGRDFMLQPIIHNKINLQETSHGHVSESCLEAKGAARGWTYQVHVTDERATREQQLSDSRDQYLTHRGYQRTDVPGSCCRRWHGTF
ncbi:hypothetical protein DPMN_168378 [Dreissena polymorpha]|uniref:Uncharacterized protein n=1 Tax=Dreissena polymorpha TaxID=45954 RepID=A0A9D4F374_DREPO|nr:hypothetical protein DPMN_168378 [Dreissena polymorpha]